ncbi:hypothetical protein PInf_013652 [Phytophthora infestans]|nr:hypothetical protein PInf_013652 [Phytophthora infestans]
MPDRENGFNQDRRGGDRGFNQNQRDQRDFNRNFNHDTRRPHEGSFGVVSSAARDKPTSHSKMTKLNPGERQGWWSAKKFDRRIRMGALVQGAVNDKPTRIPLDTGASVIVITDTFAKQLRLRDVPDHGRRIDIQGISEGKVSTTRRACVK